MPALWVMGGAAVLGALNSASSAKGQAANNIAKFRHDEWRRVSEWADQSWMQTLQQAERRRNNKAIASIALEVREKTKFWDRVRQENTSSQMSKQMRQAYSNIDTELTGRMGTNSATSRAILRSSMDNYFEAREGMNINEALRGRQREETYQRALGTRDFGFTPISEHYRGQYFGASPSDAYKTALIGGLASGAANVAGAYYMGQTNTSSGAPTGGGGQGGNRGGYGRMGPHPD